MQFDTEYEVVLHIPFWSEYKHLYAGDRAVELYDGSRLVAKGVLLEALE